MDIGGFDEELDRYWGFDNVDVGLRACMKGYIIRNVPGNAAVAYDHRAVMAHPYQRLRSPEWFSQRMRDIEMGIVTVDFL